MRQISLLLFTFLLFSCFLPSREPSLTISNNTGGSLRNVSVVIHGGGKDSVVTIGTIPARKKSHITLEIPYDFSAEIRFTPETDTEHRGTAIAYHTHGMGSESVAIRKNRVGTFLIER